VVKTIGPRELQARIDRGESVQLLDVRTPAEHARVHVPGVRLVPLDRLDPNELVAAGGFSREKPVFVLCNSGGRARRAANTLESDGFADCQVVEGGTSAWVAAGLPVNRGTSRVISLERQVRIAAGTLVLAGLGLAHFVHPQFVWLSAFVGAGLVLAGVTDWCGMGLLLAKLPWNRRGSGD
jgi:rhodanese-related sulfurtransferase